MSLAPPGLLIVLSAPSGGGKSTLCRLLRERRDDVEVSISHTTRSPRGAERHEVDYYFVDDSAFDQMIERGAFAEWAGVYGRRYGTSKAELDRIRSAGRHVLLDIDVQGALSIMRQYSDAVGVFVLPPGLGQLERRLRGRATDTEEAVARRLAEARSEIAQAKHYTHVIVNDSLEQAMADLLAIIRAAELRAPRAEAAITRLLREPAPA